MQSFFGETSNRPGDSAPYSPDLAPFDFWLFPKLKSPLKRKRFQILHEVQENTMGQLMAIGRIVWGSKVPTLKETEVSLSYVQCFLYLVSSSINVSVFLFLLLCCFLKMLFIFREGKGGRKRGRETSMWRDASHTSPTGDLDQKGTCPDLKWNQRPLGPQASTQSTEPHQPGLFFHVTWLDTFWIDIYTNTHNHIEFCHV